MIIIKNDIILRPSQIVGVMKGSESYVRKKGLFKKSETFKKYTLVIRVDDNTKYGHAYTVRFSSEELRDAEFDSIYETLHRREET